MTAAEIRFRVSNPVSKKNNQIARAQCRCGRKVRARVFPSNSVQKFAAKVRMAAKYAKAEAKWETLHDPCSATISYNPDTDEATITIRKVEWQNAGRRRRKDLGNLPDTLLDAMQGIIYDNDARIVELYVVEAGA